MNLALSLSLALASALLSPAHAVIEVAGVKFEDTPQPGRPALTAEWRRPAQDDVHLGIHLGLYVQKKDTTAQGLLDAPATKHARGAQARCQGAKLIDALVFGVENNTPEAELKDLRPRLEHLANGLRAAGEIEEDAIVKIEFVPGLGTVVSHNNKILVKDLPGEDFYRALMRIWLGEKPADRGLKARLLGETD